MIDLRPIYRTLKPELTGFEKSFAQLFTKHRPQDKGGWDGLGRMLYLQQAKFRGKRLRPLLLFLSARAVGKVKPIHRLLAMMVELIHNATLLHDDVLDEAELRRSRPTINQQWGNEMAILFGDLVFSYVFLTCAQVKSARAIAILSQTANQMCQGEMIHTRRKYDLSMTEADYLKIINHKTASLFAAACYLGALFATKNKKHQNALKNYGRNFGLAYQIIDDYLDYSNNSGRPDKTPGTDFAKGKITLPLIRLKQSLKKSGKFPLFSRNIRKLLKEHNIPDDIIGCAEKYLTKCRQSLEVLPASPARKLLATLTDSIRPRLYPPKTNINGIYSNICKGRVSPQFIL